jgi:hypothetical protein
MPVNKKERITASLRDELRRTVALKCLSNIYGREGMGLNQQHTYLEEHFHGEKKKGIISHLDQLCTAQGDYAELYEKTNKDQLKYLYTQSNSHLYFAGEHIVRDVLERVNFNGSQLCNGRYLKEQSAKTLRTVRKACTRVRQWVNEDGTPKKNGNRTIEEICELLLDDMYEFLKGKQNMDEEKVEDSGTEDLELNEDTGEDTTTGRPANWIFHGYMAFVLFGPLATESRRLDFLLNGDPPACNKKSHGRANRKKEPKQVKVPHNITLSDNGGMTLGERVQLASLELQYSRVDQEARQFNFNSLKLESDVLQSQIVRALEVANCTQDFTRYHKLEELLDDIREKMGKISSEASGSAISLKRCHELLQL